MNTLPGLRKMDLWIVAAGVLLCVAGWGASAGSSRLVRDASLSAAVVHYRLPDTGQVTPFTASFGEDADYTLNPPSFTDNGDGTVTDNVTGLIWQKADGGEMTWEAAGSYAEALSLGGRSDWRLPTNHELLGVLNHNGNPALDAAIFTMSNAEYWWTSDAMAGDASRVWAANIGGGTGPHPKSETISAGGGKRFHVRCVRGGASSARPMPSLKDNGDGTVTDLDTGLIWQQAEVSPAMTWEAALQYAEDLSLADHRDWRLPNVKELQSLNDEKISNPSIDRKYFPGASTSRYWTSTTLAKQSPRAWYVDFQAGIVSYEDKTAAMLVRCVRGGIASAAPDDTAFLAAELLGRPTATSVTVNAVPARSMEIYFEYGSATGDYETRTKTVAYAAGTPLEVTLRPLQPGTEYFYRIHYREMGASDFAAGAEHTFHTRRPPGSTFTVAIQADPHMDENTDPDTFRLTMQNMLSEKPDFMVDLGDTFMSDKLSSPDYPKVVDRVLLLRSFYDIACHSVPLFLALGNHEGEWGSRLTGSADNLPVWDTVIRKLYFPNPYPDGFYTGGGELEKYVGLRQSYYAWEWGNSLFVVLDPYWNSPQTPELSGNWSLTLGRKQYEWLRQTLESSKATFKFVFCHNLVGGWNKNGTGQMRGGVEAARYLEWGGYNPDGTWGFDIARPGWAMPIHQLLVKNNVTIFFHGHDHFFGKQDLDGIVYQEVPQPGARNTELGNRAASYGYTEGRLLGGTGYLRMRVSPSDVRVDYVQTWTPVKETGGRKNGMVADSYTVAAARSSIGLDLAAGGSATAATAGSAGAVQTGYAAATVQSGSTPYGTAVFSFTQNGIVVSEAAVPASAPTTSARMFVDYGLGIAAGPMRSAAEPVDINTGFAIVNPADTSAHLTCTLRDSQGQILSLGHGTLEPAQHRAMFIDQIQELASDLILPADFLQTVKSGSIQIDSDQALSITALRMVRNQRGDTLYTCLPVADLTRAEQASELQFPQISNGGGYTVTFVLLNASDRLQTGVLHFYADDGSPLVVGNTDGATGSAFNYSVPPGGTRLFRSDGEPAEVRVGSARLTPDAGSTTPAAAGIFTYTADGILVTESGISSATPTSHARVFIDMSGNHDSGLAIAAINDLPLAVALQAFQSDGVTPAGDRSTILDLPGNGHSARFLWQWISGLPENFRGVLDISAAIPFAALTLRSLRNGRGDFLLATFPVADMTRAAPSPLIFPHFADGGGYRTEFIFLSAGGAVQAILNFLGAEGFPLFIAR